MSNVGQWRNQGEVAKFPFRETAGLLTSDNLKLGESFLVDAQIFRPNSTVGTIHLRILTLSGSMLRGSIFAGDDLFATFQIASTELTDGIADLVSPSGISRGLLVLGSRAEEIFSSLKLGDNFFDPEQTEFEGSCVFILPEPVVNELVTGDLTYAGKVALMEGAGVRLVKVSDQELRIDAVGSTAKNEQCCQDLGEPIRLINAAAPNEFGSIAFDLEPFGEPETSQDKRQILRITPVSNGLLFSLSK